MKHNALEFAEIVQKSSEEIWILPKLLRQLLGNMTIERYCALCHLSYRLEEVEPARHGFVAPTPTSPPVKVLLPAKIIYVFSPSKHQLKDTL